MTAVPAAQVCAACEGRRTAVLQRSEVVTRLAGQWSVDPYATLARVLGEAYDAGVEAANR